MVTDETVSGIFTSKPLPDILAYNLKVLFIGYNPGIVSGKSGHHYAHKSNRFWKLLYESGLTPYRMQPEEDKKLLELGFGSTNIVDRPSKSANDIVPKELIAGAANLSRLIKEIKPKIACFVGIGVYRSFISTLQNISPGRVEISTGVQTKSVIDGVVDFVCSNPSGLNTIPYDEQLSCFMKLKRLV